MAEELQGYEFPSEVIDLPSEGKLYPEGSPFREGKLEIKYMTAREEDILTSQNLIKKGVVIEKLLNSLIVTEGITSDDLILGEGIINMDPLFEDEDPEDLILNL